MKLKCLSLVLPLLCVLTGVALGAVTGKITGVITDAQSKEPLVGVSVQVVGTTMGAQTNEDGRYTILNVPVGTYVLKISTVGYAPLEISNVEVSADLASYQSHSMTSQVTDLNQVITVTAERPLVIKDQTTSMNILRRDEILAMPTRGFDQVVGIQNSVVRMKSNVDLRQRGFRESSGPAATEMNLRGGRPSEVAYYVDGFSQQDPLSGLSTANINNNAIKEVSVVAGAFSAEYGHVSSGIVNVVTNSGSDKYSGNLEVVSDNLVGATHSYDQNFYAGDFSGPLPGLKNGFFFFSGERRWLGDRQPSSKTKEMVERFDLQNQFGDNYQRLPSNTQSGWSYQGKIDYSFSPSMKLALSANGSVDNWREYRHERIFDYNHDPRYEDKNFGANAKITHTLGANTFYNLSASYFVTQRFRGDNQKWKDLQSYQRPFADPEEDPSNLFLAWNEDITVKASVLDSTIAPGSPDDTDVVVAGQQAYWANYLKRKAAYVGLKGDMTHKVNDQHTLRAGFDFQRHTLRYFEDLDATSAYTPLFVNRYGYDANGEESDTLSWKNSAKHPINLGIYLEDRFDLQNMVINAGLRFDYFDYKALRNIDATNPLDPGRLTGVDTLDEGDFEASKKYSRLSPRLGIAFPISDKTQFHINYGKFFQRPDLRNLYVGYDFFAARITGGSFYPFASPNLEPEKTTQYEVGVTHQLGTNTAFSVTAYYKDVQDLTQIFHVSPANPNTYDIFGNIDFGTIKGLDFELKMRRTRSISLDLKYTLSYAEGTGSYSQSRYIIAWQNPNEPMKTTAPLDYDQRHNFSAIIDLRAGKHEGPKLGDFYLLENTGVNFLVMASSGVPYTPLRVDNSVTLAAYTPIPTGPINSQSLPWTFRIDMKLERMIKVGKYTLTPYLWVRNLLDRDNVLAVHETTGKADENGWLNTSAGQDFANTYGSYGYNLIQFNPKNWDIPRMFLFGLRASF
jgi:outer membrane receptor protein involved in Fe transport